MSVYSEPQEIHVGEDVPFTADYNPCEESTPPVLTGMTFQFTMVPKDGTGATITKSCTVTGTVISWAVAAADCATRLNELFRAQLRRVDAGSNRVWMQVDVKVIE